MKVKAFENFCDRNKTAYIKNEPMSKHTSFKIGGEADYFVTVKSTDELLAVIKALKENGVPYFIIGKGSNLLISDKGIEGAVINLCSLDGIKTEGELITASAGASLAAVCAKALENSLTGMEFAYGIPGTVGGALYMNAGAYGGEMSQIVDSCEYIDSDGQVKRMLLCNMRLSYRKSIFCQGNMIITSVNLRLKKGNSDDIRLKMEDFLERRKSKQPLEFPSAGSTFKRPEGNFAGTLIEKNGLKGAAVGGAAVSKKHAGFIINTGGATCEDVKKLIEHIKKTVLAADRVALEPEVIFIGRK